VFCVDCLGLYGARPRRPTLADGWLTDALPLDWPRKKPLRMEAPMTTALTRSNCPNQGDDRDQRKRDDPLDAAVADPSDLVPLCDEPE
jgi:hypothetical protein